MHETPDVDAPRRKSVFHDYLDRRRHPRPGGSFLQRRVGRAKSLATIILACGTAIGGIATAYRAAPAGAHAINTDSIATLALATRIDALERKHVAYERRQDLELYMLCSLMKRVDPPGVPPDCIGGRAP